MCREITNKAFTRCGFSKEGLLRKDRYIDGRYKDIILLAILKE